MTTKYNTNIIMVVLSVIAVTMLLIGSYIMSHKAIDIIYLCILYMSLGRYTYLSIKDRDTI